jgi:hypothetical protein
MLPSVQIIRLPYFCKMHGVNTFKIVPRVLQRFPTSSATRTGSRAPSPETYPEPANLLPTLTTYFNSPNITSILPHVPETYKFVNQKSVCSSLSCATCPFQLFLHCIHCISYLVRRVLIRSPDNMNERTAYTVNERNGTKNLERNLHMVGVYNRFLISSTSLCSELRSSGLLRSD